MTRSADTPLRMLQVANQPGPFYCFLRPLIFELMNRGVQVDVACNQTDSRFPRLAEAGMNVLPLSVGPWARPATWKVLSRQLRAIMNGGRYDICVVHTPAISWVTRREAARARIPVVAYTAHGLPFFERQGWLTRRSLLFVEKSCARYTDLLLVVNSVDAAAARRYRLVRRGGTVVHIPGPGIDTARWQPPPPTECLAALRRELGLAASTRVVGFMGRLMATKGVFDLVEAMVRLVRHRGQDAALVVAGEGPLADEMRRRAVEAGVGDRVLLLGWRDDVVALMHLSDVLVLPSTYREGLPTVLMEAGAAGKPVVAYRNRGSDDIVVDGQTGFSVPAGDVAALADALGRCLADPQLCRTLGDAGRRRVTETFGFRQGVAAQLAAYAGALEAKGIDASMLRGEPGQPVFRLTTGGAPDPTGGPGGNSKATA
jgi:glycosyltransferase involved in cell wall biosynthesis